MLIARSNQRTTWRPILSDVEMRIIKTDYTFQFKGHRYVIERADIRSGFRGATVHIEKLRDGSLAVRFQQHYLRYRSCDSSAAEEPLRPLPSQSAKNPAQKR